MNSYQPDPLETAVWNVLQTLINSAGGNEALRIGYQDAGEWGDQYAVMSITSREPQGQDVRLGFDEESGEYRYRGQRNGQISVTFFGPQHGWRAENLVSGLQTESASDLFHNQKVVMYRPQVLSNVPVQDKERWLQAAAVVVNYRTSYIYSDRVGIIEIVDLTATVGDTTINKQITFKTA